MAVRTTGNREDAISTVGNRETLQRLDVPPRADTRIELPEDFGCRFIVFADAEEEFDWNAPFSRSSVSVSHFAALPEANARFASAGCVPTYMVDWPVVDTPASAAIIRGLLEDGSCDVGTQLHPWVNPPHEEAVTADNSYLCNLPANLQRAKLIALTDRIEAMTGKRPTCYRAGRYGVGPDTSRLLAEVGYTLDVSIRAGFDYRHQNGPDFSKHPVWPYRLGPTLAELPLTTAFTGALRHASVLKSLPMLKGPLARMGLLDRVPLTPEGVPLADALSAIRRLRNDGHRLFSLSYHTPTLVPGHTPYVRDASDLKRFWSWWDGVFSLFAKHGVTGARLSEVEAALNVGARG